MFTPLITSWPVAIETLNCNRVVFLFPVLIFRALSLYNDNTKKKGACRNSAHDESPVKWLFKTVQLMNETCWKAEILNPVSDVLFCVRSVGPPPELVRQREAKWINIMVQWDRILLKKTSKVRIIRGTIPNWRTSAVMTAEFHLSASVSCCLYCTCWFIVTLLWLQLTLQIEQSRC